MNNSNSVANTTEISSIDRLVNVADAIFDRASKLDGIKLGKKEEGASEVIGDTRDDAFKSCIEVWMVVELMLPKSGLDQVKKKELTIDGYKVMSRCYHRLGNLDGARKNITKAIDEGYVDGFISLGAICLDLKDFQSAELAFKSAITKEAQVTRAHAGLGELYFAMGTEALKDDPKHADYFTRSEEQFLIAGKERFNEGFERAMDLFETIGWKDKALSIGESAAKFYDEHKENYGGKLLSLNGRLRKLAGADRHDKIVHGVGRKLSDVLGGKKKST